LHIEHIGYAKNEEETVGAINIYIFAEVHWQSWDINYAHKKYLCNSISVFATAYLITYTFPASWRKSRTKLFGNGLDMVKACL